MLHNTDKNSMDRNNPQPNTHDTSYTTGFPIVNVPRPAHGIVSTNYRTPGGKPPATPALFSGYKRLVASETVELIASGATLTTTTAAHNLGYAPLVEAAINDATVSGISGLVNVPLPLIVQGSTSGGNVLIQMWLFPLVDATNVYFQLYNATGNSISLGITYYLYQQTAV